MRVLPSKSEQTTEALSCVSSAVVPESFPQTGALFVWTLVVTLDVLFGVMSWGENTVAVFVIGPVVDGAVRLILMSADVAREARLPARVHVAVVMPDWVAVEHVQ